MTSDRRLHFVGTMPQFDTAAKAFDWQLNELDGQIRRLSGGETGPRLRWFVPLIKELKGMPWTRAVREGDFTAYGDVDRLAMRRGARLTANRIPLRLAERAHEELAILGDRATRERPLQVGVPCYLDLAMFTFGPVGMFRYSGGFFDAVAQQVDEIASAAGNRVVFQLETPVALVAVTAAPWPARSLLAEVLGRLVVRQAMHAPRGSRFGVHLCLGDLGHRAMRQLPSADPLVRLANAVQRHWPDGRTLEFLHLPMSGGDRPPTTDPAFYAPLHGLDLLPSTTVVAGIAHEAQAVADQFAVRHLVEHALGRQVDIATSCGLGRREVSQAERAVERMRALVD